MISSGLLSPDSNFQWLNKCYNSQVNPLRPIEQLKTKVEVFQENKPSAGPPVVSILDALGGLCNA